MRLSTKSLAAVAAFTLGAVAAPMAASAQSYGYSQNYGTGAYAPSYAYGNGYQQRQYDPCARERQGRTGAGAVVGDTTNIPMNCHSAYVPIKLFVIARTRLSKFSALASSSRAAFNQLLET